jgi:hypothetical protein
LVSIRWVGFPSCYAGANFAASGCARRSSTASIVADRAACGGISAPAFELAKARPTTSDRGGPRRRRDRRTSIASALADRFREKRLAVSAAIALQAVGTNALPHYPLFCSTPRRVSGLVSFGASSVGGPLMPSANCFAGPIMRALACSKVSDFVTGSGFGDIQPLPATGFPLAPQRLLTMLRLCNLERSAREATDNDSRR